MTTQVAVDRGELITLAAQILRRRYNDDVSDELDRVMHRWAMRVSSMARGVTV